MRGVTLESESLTIFLTVKCKIQTYFCFRPLYSKFYYNGFYGKMTLKENGKQEQIVIILFLKIRDSLGNDTFLHGSF